MKKSKPSPLTNLPHASEPMQRTAPSHSLVHREDLGWPLALSYPNMPFSQFLAEAQSVWEAAHGEEMSKTDKDVLGDIEILTYLVPEKRKQILTPCWHWNGANLPEFGPGVVIGKEMLSVVEFLYDRFAPLPPNIEFPVEIVRISACKDERCINPAHFLRQQRYPSSEERHQLVDAHSDSPRLISSAVQRGFLSPPPTPVRIRAGVSRKNNRGKGVTRDIKRPPPSDKWGPAINEDTIFWNPIHRPKEGYSYVEDPDEAEYHRANALTEAGRTRRVIPLTGQYGPANDPIPPVPVADFGRGPSYRRPQRYVPGRHAKLERNPWTGRVIESSRQKTKLWRLLARDNPQQRWTGDEVLHRLLWAADQSKWRWKTPKRWGRWMNSSIISWFNANCLGYFAPPSDQKALYHFVSVRELETILLHWGHMYAKNPPPPQDRPLEEIRYAPYDPGALDFELNVRYEWPIERAEHAVCTLEEYIEFNTRNRKPKYRDTSPPESTG